MLQFQAVAEKTAKNFRGLLFCCTLYVTRAHLSRKTCRKSAAKTNCM